MPCLPQHLAIACQAAAAAAAAPGGSRYWLALCLWSSSVTSCVLHRLLHHLTPTCCNTCLPPASYSLHHLTPTCLPPASHLPSCLPPAAPPRSRTLVQRTTTSAHRCKSSHQQQQEQQQTARASRCRVPSSSCFKTDRSSEGKATALFSMALGMGYGADGNNLPQLLPLPPSVDLRGFIFLS